MEGSTDLAVLRSVLSPLVGQLVLPNGRKDAAQRQAVDLPNRAHVLEEFRSVLHEQSLVEHERHRAVRVVQRVGGNLTTRNQK